MYSWYWKFTSGIPDKEEKDPYVLIRERAKEQKISIKVEKKLEWFIFRKEQASTDREVWEYFSISKKTWYKWKKRFDPWNLNTLEEQSKTPITKRKRMITREQERRVVTLRKQHIRYGKMKIQRIYEREYKEELSSWQIQKVIEDKDLYYHPQKAKRSRKKRQRSKLKKRITTLTKKKLAGFLLQVDTIVKYWNGMKFYILTGIDVYTKVAYAKMTTSHSSRASGVFLKEFCELYNIPITNVQSDEGSEFKKDFEKACKELKIEHYYSRVKTPQDNGCDERFNRTLQEEFMQLGNFIPNVKSFNKNLREWLIEYNFKRPHQSLEYDTPMEFLFKVVDLSPMYSSSTRWDQY